MGLGDRPTLFSKIAKNDNKKILIIVFVGRGDRLNPAIRDELGDRGVVRLRAIQFDTQGNRRSL